MCTKYIVIAAYHPKLEAAGVAKIRNAKAAESEQTYWYEEARKALRARTDSGDERVARNVIVFLGDGMSVSTVAAARIRLGQQENSTGEEAALAFDTFPITGLAKVTCLCL